jgi:hypothetical protein
VTAQLSAVPRAVEDRGPDPVDTQLARLEARLLMEACGDPGRQAEVLDSLAVARAGFAGATVRRYLPILVERRVRELLGRDSAP